MEWKNHSPIDFAAYLIFIPADFISDIYNCISQSLLLFGLLLWQLKTECTQC